MDIQQGGYCPLCHGYNASRPTGIRLLPHLREKLPCEVARRPGVDGFLRPDVGTPQNRLPAKPPARFPQGNDGAAARPGP